MEHWTKYSILILSIFLTSSILSPVPSHSAAVVDWQKIDLCFRGIWVDEYIGGSCHNNVYELVKRCLGSNLNDAKVLFVLNNNEDLEKLDRMAPFPIYNGRKGQKHFFYHLFVELDGKILDLDYGDAPSIVKSEEYFRSMFKLPEKNSFTLKLVSAANYQDHYYDESVWDIMYRKSLFTDILLLRDYLADSTLAKCKALLKRIE